MAIATVDADGPPERSHGPAEERRCAGFRVLHEHALAEGARARRQHEGRRRPALEIAPAPGPLPRAGVARRGRGGRRLFRLSRARQPKSEPGRAGSRSRSRAASRSRPRSCARRPASASARFRARRTGPGSGSPRLRSSSGAIARSGCTTGSSIGASGRMVHGRHKRLFSLVASARRRFERPAIGRLRSTATKMRSVRRPCRSSFSSPSLIVVVSPGTGVLYTLATGLTRGTRAQRDRRGVRLHPGDRPPHMDGRAPHGTQTSGPPYARKRRGLSRSWLLTS